MPSALLPSALLPAARRTADVVLFGALLAALVVSAPSRSRAQDAAQASATLTDADGAPLGTVLLTAVDDDRVRVEVVVAGLTPGFHGFHVHTGDCLNDAGQLDFDAAGGHFGHEPGGRSHGDHPADFPPLLADAAGQARLVTITDRVGVEQLLGRAAMVHAGPDNLANIPPRYRAVDGGPVPDAVTLATGDSGGRVGCGTLAEGAAVVPAAGPATARAVATVINPDGATVGSAVLTDVGAGVRVEVEVGGLAPGFHGMHVHAADCLDDAGEPDFDAAGGHLGHVLGEVDHRDHPADLPGLLADQAGRASLVAVTDRVTVDDVLGRALMVHAGRDNLANVPDRYVSTVDGTAPDAETRTTGDSGGRVACGTLVPGAAAERLAGDDRVATALAIAGSAFPGTGAAAAVVLARADAFPDGLTGTPFGAAVGGPVLLTAPDRLDPRVADALRRLVPAGGTAYLLGGEQALTAGVAAAVRDLGLDVERLGGATRYETAAQIAERIPAPAGVLVTTGTTYPDALSAGAAGAALGYPVLLSEGERPAAATDAALAQLDVPATAVGGPAAAAYPELDGVVGATRIETAVEVARAFDLGGGAVGLARAGGTGDAADTQFADALAGGAHVGRLGGPLLLTPGDQLAPSVVAYLCEVRPSVGTVYGYGGVQALADGVLTAAAGAAASRPCAEPA